MAKRADKRSNEQLFCWEQIEKTNRLFRVSYAFAPADCADTLLPLHALFSVVEEACSRHSDEQVARGKLAWWRQECLGRDPGPGSHPIVRELARNATLDGGQRASIARLLDDAESRLDEVAPANLDDLRRRCAKLSEPQLNLESSLCGFENPGSAGSASGPGAPMGLVQLLRESLRTPGTGAFWWLPLDLLARHGVNRAGVKQTPDAEPVKSLFSMILGEGRAWADAQSSRAGRVPASPRRRHMAVHAALHVRQLGRLQGAGPAGFRGELNRITPVDLFHAWRTARRINRP